MSTRMFMMLGAGVAGMLVVGQGCRVTGPNPMHCFNNEGDEYCRGRDPSRPYCERGQDECISPDSDYGCLAERPVDECYSPCGGRSTLAENGECVMVEDSSSGSSSGGTETEGSSGSGSESSSTTGPMPCLGNEDCPDAAAPFCEPGSGECVACDGTEDPDAACTGVDPGLPVCDGGACVQCTAENPGACGGKTPVCDDATNTCVPCTAHDQCGPAACNLFNGACLPGDRVVHVGGSKPDFATLNEAVTGIAVDEGGTIIVHAGMGSYDEAVPVTAGRTVAFLAAEIGPGIEPPRWIRSSGNVPQLEVNAGTTVLVDGLQLSSNASSMVPAVSMTGGRAWLDRSRVVQNSGGGIVAQSNAELVLRNCFVGGSNNNVNAVRVDGATAEIVYSSLTSGFAAATALSCNAPIDVSVRNSILLVGAATDAVVCPEATIAGSATEDVVGTFDGTQDWFTDYFGADLSLTPSGALVFADIAQWQASDPLTDIDGDPRPTVDGTPDYAGADVPVMATAHPELDR